MLAPLFDSSNSKKRGQYGKYTPNWKEHGVIENFTSKLEAIALRMHEGNGFDLTQPHFFTTNHYKSEHP